MPTYRLTDLNHGMDKYTQPEALPPTALQDAIGVDLSKPGVIRPLTGGKPVNADVNVVHQETAWVGGTFTIYYTTTTATAGLYRLTSWTAGTEPGTLISTAITGEFSVAVLNNVAYIAATQARLRDDGTTCTTWGITAPAAAPTLSLSTQLTKSIDTCETTTGWSTLGSSVVHHETSTYMQGTAALGLQYSSAVRGGSTPKRRIATRAVAPQSSSSEPPAEERRRQVWSLPPLPKASPQPRNRSRMPAPSFRRPFLGCPTRRGPPSGRARKRNPRS
jgi:hypothetical protein